MTSNASAIDVSTQFTDFIETIRLDGQPKERIRSAIGAITTVAAKHLEVEEADIIVQGSFANGTAIEPVDGAYDVDLVVPCISKGTGAVTALDEVERVFLDNGNYKDKVCDKNRNRCVRLNYADDDIGSFHVDVVPARPAQDDSLAPLEVPSRSKQSWNETAPAEYTEWAKDEGQEFAETVMMLKRWRDENQGVRAAIKSITLQVLVAQHLGDESKPATRLASTLRNIADDLSWRTSPPDLPNPVLPTENLSERWSENAFEDFRDKISDAADQAEKALRAEDLATACDQWKELLGQDFPEAPAEEHGIELSDTSHALGYSDKGWTRTHKPQFLEIQAHKVRNLKPNYRPRRYRSGEVLTANSAHSLRFQTLSALPQHSVVYWQVVNTGHHAKKNGQERGDFYDSRPLSELGIRKSSYATASHYEGLAYTGVHRIRVIAVKNSVVVAESEWLNVTIRAKAVPFQH